MPSKLTPEDELEQARDAAFEMLDARFSNAPEWIVFKALNSAWRKLTLTLPEELALPKRRRPRNESYAALAFKAIREANAPLKTADLLAYVAKEKQLSEDLNKLRGTIQSAFSKDMRLKSIPWDNARAWWFADSDPPPQQL